MRPKSLVSHPSRSDSEVCVKEYDFQVRQKMMEGLCDPLLWESRYPGKFLYLPVYGKGANDAIHRYDLRGTSDSANHAYIHSEGG